jgi:hypothetical protein
MRMWSGDPNLACVLVAKTSDGGPRGLYRWDGGIATYGTHLKRQANIGPEVRYAIASATKVRRLSIRVG